MKRKKYRYEYWKFIFLEGKLNKIWSELMKFNWCYLVLMVFDNYFCNFYYLINGLGVLR